MAALRGIPLSKISPAFLHSNSTSHTWPFSAIAELIDNAYDPDVSANELWIDKALIHGKPCLIFEDDGNGMDNEHLLNMLSFGYCEKGMYESKGYRPPIGHYGNGFKSGSMRLGKDALVFTVCETSASVGFMSQSYLEAINADCVFVPIIEYRLPHLERFKSQESRNNLEAILKYSPFTTEKDIKEELRAISSREGKTGSKIVIYNLKRHTNGAMELDFESDPHDIRNPEAHEVDLTSVYHRTAQLETSEYIRSLRCYCGILFLRPRMKIYIRGVKVKSRLVSKSLSHTEMDIYRPTWLTKPLQITFGFTPQNEDYGVMFYHRNRLIKAFEKLGYQKQANDLGVGVVGVVQVDFLKPIHNKQDFEKDEKYNAIMSAIALKLNDYWNEKKNGQPSQQITQAVSIPDWLWVQCEHCLKWRRLPDTHRTYTLPDMWFCHMNPDPTHNRCDIIEEPEDEDEAVQRPTYEKTFKKKQEEKKRRKQAEIEAKEKELQAKEAELLERQRRQQMNEVSSSQESRKNIATLQKELLEAKRREEMQKHLILQMQHQKKQLEEQQNSLMVAAQSLQSANNTSTELLQVADALTNQSPVSSTSGKTSRGKRKSSDSMLGDKRRIKIKTETGEMLAITTNDDFEEEEETEQASPNVFTDTSTPVSALSRPAAHRPSGARLFATAARINDSSAAEATPKPASKRRRPRSHPEPSAKEGSAAVIDLTLDDDNGAGFSVPEGVLTGEQQDVKPNVDELNRQMEAEADKSSHAAENKDTSSGAMDEISDAVSEDNPLVHAVNSTSGCMREEVNDGGDTAADGDNAANTVAARHAAAAEHTTAKPSAAKNAANAVVPSASGDVGQADSPVKEEEKEDCYKLLKQKYRLLQHRFGALQRNVHRLLSFIVPDVDLGSEEDIEHIVMGMIRVNCASSQEADMQDFEMNDLEKAVEFLDEDSRTSQDFRKAPETPKESFDNEPETSREFEGEPEASNDSINPLVHAAAGTVNSSSGRMHEGVDKVSQDLTENDLKTPEDFSGEEPSVPEETEQGEEAMPDVDMQKAEELAETRDDRWLEDEETRAQRTPEAEGEESQDGPHHENICQHQDSQETCQTQCSQKSCQTQDSQKTETQGSEKTCQTRGSETVRSQGYKQTQSEDVPDDKSPDTDSTDMQQSVHQDFEDRSESAQDTQRPDKGAEGDDENSETGAQASNQLEARETNENVQFETAETRDNGLFDEAGSQEHVYAGEEQLEAEGTHESEPLGADETQESEPFGADETQESEPLGADETQESEPLGADETQESEHFDAMETCESDLDAAVTQETEELETQAEHGYVGMEENEHKEEAEGCDNIQQEPHEGGNFDQSRQYCDAPEEENSRGHTEEENSRGYTKGENSRGHTEEENSCGHTEEENSRGHTEQENSRGHTEEENSHGHTEEENSHGHTEEENSRGHTDVNNMESDVATDCEKEPVESMDLLDAPNFVYGQTHLPKDHLAEETERNEVQDLQDYEQSATSDFLEGSEPQPDEGTHLSSQQETEGSENQEEEMTLDFEATPLSPEAEKEDVENMGHL